MVFQNNVLSGAAGSGTTVHTIDQSIRFNNYDTAYMKRTPSSSGNQRTWTLSMWVKRSPLGNYGLFGTRTGNTTNFFAVEFNSDDLFVQGYASSSQTLRFETNAHFRDVSAWYNIQLVADTTNVISTERIRIYVNGERITSFASATYPTQNYDTHINSSSYENAIGCHNTGSDRVFGGYMTDIVMLDGTAADPSSFGETNSSGIWVPKDVSGLTFGTNGFHIDGRDASDLGDDESGQGNDYTTVNLATHDQVLDSPTNNFCTFNSLDNRGSGTLSEGNLKMAFAATNDNVTGTQGISSGKWYWEAYIVDFNNTYIGVQDSNVSATGYAEKAVALWYGGFIYEDDSDTGDRAIATSGSAYTNGDVVGVAFDAGNKKIWWSKNGQWYTANASSTSTIAISEVVAGNSAQVITRSPDFFMPFFGNYTHSTAIFNFGQEGTFSGNKTAGGNSDGNGVGNFFSAVPSGFLALCTNNLGS